MAGAEERRVYARALFRAGAKMRACALQDRELRAGAMLRLAGFSAGRSVCARGGCSAGQSESIAAFCVRIMTGARFYRNVLRSVHACCLPQSAKQDGLRYVPFLFRRGSGSPFVRSRIVGAVIRLYEFTSGLRVFMWRSRRRTKETRRTESAARFVYAFAQASWLCGVFRGESAGAARPRLRQGAIGSLDSLHLIRGVGA